MIAVKQGRVFIHIGPPKTATTALQYIFQSFDSSLFYYGGINQPREGDSSDIARRLHTYCCQLDVDASELRGEVSQILSSGRDVVISEEMFLVDGRVLHQDKLRNLNFVLGEFDLTIVTCVRDPVAGLQSLYQELFKNLSLLEKLSFGRFLRSNQAKVFDYQNLDIAIRRAGFTAITYIDFEALVAGELSLAEVFGPEFPIARRLIVEKINVGAYSNPDRRQLQGLSIHDALGWRQALAIPLAKTSSFAQRAWKTARSLPIYPSRVRKLEVPTTMAIRLRGEARKVCQ